MKMSEVLNFSTFYNKVKNEKFTFNTMYKLAKLVKLIEKETDFYREKLNEIIKEYAEFDENGNVVYSENHTSIKLKEGVAEECNKKIAELQSIEIEIPNIRFKVEEFNNIELSFEEMEGIAPFIEN